MPFENDGNHIAVIMSRVPCGRHGAGTDDPCWWMPSKRRGPAVCGKRIKAAGFVGAISATSLSTKPKAGSKFVKRFKKD